MAAAVSGSSTLKTSCNLQDRYIEHYNCPVAYCGAPTVLLWKLPLYLQVPKERNSFPSSLWDSLKNLTSILLPEMLPSTTLFLRMPFYVAPEIQEMF